MDSMQNARNPADLQKVFQAAEEMVSRYFGQRHEDPARGRIEISNERYLLIRAASLSYEFFNLVREILGAGREREADQFAQDLVYDLAHALGKTDARRFHAWSHARDPISRLACGPVHFAHSGWAAVRIDPRSVLAAGPDYVMIYTHQDSFEVDAWEGSGRRPELPVCVMNAGYSSGWCEESFGLPLVAVEVNCRARGDDACRFLMAPPRRIEEHLARFFPAASPAGQGAVRVPDFFVRQRLEEELRRSRDELERRVAERTAELTRVNRRLEEEMRVREQAEQEALRAARWEAIGNLVGGIAHDFNNLMGVVIGEASLLEDSLAADSPVRAAVARMREAGQEAANLTRQLINFSRPALQKKEPLDLSAAVRESLSLLERLIPENIRLRIDLRAGVGPVRMDRGQLGQVVMNLVLNARDAMPRGGQLDLRAFCQDDPAGTSFAVLEVEDDGLGMETETAARVFEPFFSNKTGGTGLGLAVVQRVVQGAGGTVGVESAPGRGSRFWVRLPIAAGGAAEASEAGPGVAPDGTGETVLVVEDQAALRRMFEQMLAACGYRVLVSGDPREALRWLGEPGREIALLLTDVVMPELNGRELAERAFSLRPDLKVLFMSGYPDDEVLCQGIERGRAELLVKPFTPAQLSERIRRLLDS